MEELVAELGAAFLCAEHGISLTPRQDHAEYLKSWVSVLKGDSKAICWAAAKASQAVTYLNNLQPKGKALRTGVSYPKPVDQECTAGNQRNMF